MEDSSASQISFTIKDGNNHPVNEDDRNHTNASEDPLFHIYNVLNAASQSSGFESLVSYLFICRDFIIFSCGIYYLII